MTARRIEAGTGETGTGSTAQPREPGAGDGTRPDHSSIPLEAVEVTQADREAAACLLIGGKVAGGDGGTFIIRVPSIEEAVQAFARHAAPLRAELEAANAEVEQLRERAEKAERKADNLIGWFDWLASCEAATLERYQMLKKPPVGELARHRSICERILQAFKGFPAPGTIGALRRVKRALASTPPAQVDAGEEPCEQCDDSGWRTMTDKVWTGEGARVGQEPCDCICGEDVRRELSERSTPAHPAPVTGERDPGWTEKGHAWLDAGCPPLATADAAAWSAKLDALPLAEKLRKAAMDCAGSPLEEAVPICRLLDEAADALSSTGDAGEEVVERVAIWSNEHNAYWRANASGYTIRLSAIGIYERAEAERHIAGIAEEKRLSLEPIPSFLPAPGQWEAALTKRAAELRTAAGRIKAELHANDAEIVAAELDRLCAALKREPRG